MDEVIAQSRLKTWSVQGPKLDRVISLTADTDAWMAVPFGSVVHVSSDDGEDFSAWLARTQPDHPWTVQAVPTGLEDVFIHLSRHAQDNFR
jgi:ABC-2 type transport system ATP-binding protein